MYVKDYFKSKPEVSGYIDAYCTLHQKFWLKNKIGMKNFDNKTCWSVKETTADAMIYMYEGNNCWLNDTRNICSSSLPFVCVDRGLRTKIFMSLIYNHCIMFVLTGVWGQGCLRLWIQIQQPPQILQENQGQWNTPIHGHCYCHCYWAAALYTVKSLYNMST